MTTKIVILPKPTKEQQQILNDGAASKLVIAVPGSGKTTLLFQSIRQDCRCLMLCYSRKVRLENKAKAKQLKHLDVHTVVVHTLDSFCFNIVNDHKELAGYTGDLIPDNNFDEALLFELYEKANADFKANVPYDLACEIVEKSVSKFTLKECFHKHDQDYSDYFDTFKRIRDRYLKKRRTAGFISFSEQIKACLNLFNKHPEVLTQVADAYGLLLVDELQDLNRDRIKIVELLTKGIRQSVLVGDDAQSIFKFNGADDNNFRRILNLDAKQFELTQSHRCPKPIAALASWVRSNIKDVTDIQMWSDKDGQSVMLRGFETYTAEYVYVAHQIKLLCEQGVSLGDIVVLARKHDSLQQCMRQLLKFGILFENKYTEEAYLKNDLSNLNDPVLCSLFEGLIYLLRLIEYGYDEKLVMNVLTHFEFNAEPDAFTYIKTELESNNKEGRKSKITGLKLLGNLFVNANKARSLDSKILKITDYISRRFKGTEKYYVDAYLAYAYMLSQQFSNAEEFIEQLKVTMNRSGVGVSLRTVHVSKGLEFKHVFLLDADTTLFPYVHSKKHHDNANDELKLFYVAITRCIETLTICSVVDADHKFTKFLKLKAIKKWVDIQKV